MPCLISLHSPLGLWVRTYQAKHFCLCYKYYMYIYIIHMYNRMAIDTDESVAIEPIVIIDTDLMESVR